MGRTLLNLALTPHLSPAARPAVEPLVSVVIPARNEAASIERTVRAFLAQDYPDFEIIVVDDRSTDGTRALVSQIDDSRVHLVDGVETPQGWLGKPWALEQGSRIARGGVILFVDADVVYAPVALRAGVAGLERSGGSLISFMPHFEMHGLGEHAGMGMLVLVPALFPIWFFNRVQWPRFGLGAGTGNMMTRDALEAIGHCTALRDRVVDDIAMAQTVRRSGRRTTIVHGDRLVNVRMYDGVHALIDGFTKNIFASMGRNYALAAVMFVLMILCHLAPYLWALLGDGFAIATVVLISVTRVILFRATGHSVINAIFLHPVMIALWAYIFLRSVWITGVRGQIRWRGRVYPPPAR